MTPGDLTRPVRAELPATPAAARQARAALRHALAAWGLTALAPEAELMLSELIANAAEHAPPAPIGLTIRPHATPAGHRGVACEITDTSPAVPAARTAAPGDERGRGLAIITALADASGYTRTPAGKTAWFTLTTRDPEPRAQPEPEPELEPGA